MIDRPTFDERAEGIIRLQGLTFALAMKAGNQKDMREARAMLKQAIMDAFVEIASSR